MTSASMFVLLEEDRLRNSFFGFPKVAQPYAHESIPLPWIQGHSFSQPQSDVRHFFA